MKNFKESNIPRQIEIEIVVNKKFFIKEFILIY